MARKASKTTGRRTKNLQARQRRTERRDKRRSTGALPAARLGSLTGRKSSNGDSGERGVSATQLRATLHRYRWQMAPLYAGAATFAGGAAAHEYLPPLLTAGVAVAGSAGAWWWAKQAFPRLSERVYTSAVAVAAGSWLTAATAADPTTAPLPGILGAATLAAAVPWWYHRRIRDHIVADRTQEAWPAIAELVGLAGTKLRKYHTRGLNWEARIQLVPGRHTLDDVEKVAARIETALQVRPGALRIRKDKTRSDWVNIAVVADDPFRKDNVIAHPATLNPAAWGPASRSIYDLCPYGFDETGAEVEISLFDNDGARHCVTAGTNGSGKSAGISVELAHVAACKDAIGIVIDLGKYGRPFIPWNDCLYLPPITEVADAKRMLQALVEIIKNRASRPRKTPTFKCTEKNPAINLVVDEGYDLAADPECADFLLQIGQKGRSEGVRLSFGTQRPDVDSLGSGKLDGQFKTRIGYRMGRKTDVRFIFPEDWRELNTSLFEVPGVAYLKDFARLDDPRPTRAYAMFDPEVVEAIAQHLATQRPLPEAATAAIFTKYGFKPATTATTPTAHDDVVQDSVTQADVATQAGVDETTGAQAAVDQQDVDQADAAVAVVSSQHEVVDSGNNRITPAAQPGPVKGTEPREPKNAEGVSATRSRIAAQAEEFAAEFAADNPLPATTLADLVGQQEPARMAALLDEPARQALLELQQRDPSKDATDARILVIVRTGGVYGARMRDIRPEFEIDVRTITRRLNDLIDMGLVARLRKGVYADPSQVKDQKTSHA